MHKIDIGDISQTDLFLFKGIYIFKHKVANHKENLMEN